MVVATAVLSIGCVGGDDDDDDLSPLQAPQFRPSFSGQSALGRDATPVFDPCHAAYCSPFQDAHTNISCVMATLICTSTMTPVPTATMSP